MRIYRLIPILILLFVIFGTNAKRKNQEYPRAEIKVEYNYHEKFLRGRDEVIITLKK